MRISPRLTVHRSFEADRRARRYLISIRSRARRHRRNLPRELSREHLPAASILINVTAKQISASDAWNRLWSALTNSRSSIYYVWAGVGASADLIVQVITDKSTLISSCQIRISRVSNLLQDFDVGFGLLRQRPQSKKVLKILDVLLA